jgi:SecD/SecF fusion protein
MIENASRQLLLVLLAIAAGIVCIVTLSPAIGPDLKGGTQLRYEVPKDILDALVTKEGASIDEIMAQSIGVIRDRIDPSGALDVPVTRTGESGILIELPALTSEELKRVEDRIANLGKLEMRIVADDDYAAGTVRFNMAAEKQRLEAWLKQPGNKELVLEDLRNIRRFNDDLQAGPMAAGKLAWYPRLITPSTDAGDTWEYSFAGIPELAGSTVKVYDDADFAGGLIPEAWQQKPLKDRRLVELVALNMHDMAFFGEDLDPAGVSPGTGRNGGLAVNYRLRGDKTGDYGNWSDKHKGKCSAIVLNGVVKSAPRFQGRIAGNGIIEGSFTRTEVEELVKVLRTGSLRVEPELQSRLTIGATLGADSIRLGMWSLLAGTLLVFAFMLWYYRMPGIIACITLVLNVTLLYAAMLFMQATLTLPGLGGIVLTMGMAVDANVLIYERIREELATGKDLLRSVRAGFERAMSAILDSNITTFLVGLVLFNIGIGPVKGFAVTLMAGIVTTVFTQFFVTRLLFHYALEKNRLADYRPRSLFANINLDYVKHMKKCLAISGAVILAGLGYTLFVAPRETTLGMDFTGGADLQMVTAQAVSADEVRTRLRDDVEFHREYPNFSVNTAGKLDSQDRASQFVVRLKLTDSRREAIEVARQEWRKQRAAQEQGGEQAPQRFSPPYVERLKAVFAAELVKPAFTEPQTIPDAAPDSNLQFAQIKMHFQTPVKVAEAQQALDQAKLARGRVTVPGDTTGATLEAKDLLVEWMTQNSTKTWELAEIARAALASLKDATGNDIVLSDPFPEAQEMQGRVVNDMRNAAIGALILACGLIVLYLRIRFHEYRYGIAAVLALIHDVLFALIAVVICNHLGIVHAELSLAMVACFLTIIGYSVNDTIVIFDRIRENLISNARLGVKEDFRALINRTLNQTMSRTLLTSGVTLFVVVAQFLVNWGRGSDLESFAFGMMVGMVAGVYSTIFIAAPILIWMHRDGDVVLPPEEVDQTVMTEAAPPAS